MILESPRGPIGAYRRYWLPELAALAGLTLAAIAVFAVWPLDVTTARWFFRPGRPDPWPVAEQPVWLVFYRSAPWLTGILAIAGFALLLTGLIRPGAGRLRRHGVFLQLCVAIGPGIVINGILKDHWGRPRPRQIVEFGGDLAYAQPLLPSSERGKSFPCGHCSVGYLYAAGWWLWRRSHPRRAAASLAVGLTLGTLLGFGRMAAGGHFLSDAVWAGLIALGVAHVLYFYVLRIPAREDARAENTAVDALSASIVAAGVITPLLKEVAGRSRPRAHEGTYHFRPFSGGQSFPSGHATQAFAVASVVAAHYDNPWVDGAAYGVAGLVGLARLDHNAHFASDVVTGAIIGTTVGRALVRFNEGKRLEWAGKPVTLEPWIGPHAEGLAVGLQF